jgi:hypothetical protein
MKPIGLKLVGAFYKNKLKIDWAGETLKTPTLFFTSFKYDILSVIRHDAYEAN